MFLTSVACQTDCPLQVGPGGNLQDLLETLQTQGLQFNSCTHALTQELELGLGPLNSPYTGLA